MKDTYHAVSLVRLCRLLGVSRQAYYQHLWVREERRRSRVYTTQSSHWLRKYPNLIKDQSIDRKNQVWVSDITYWKSKVKNYYISFITDAYSKKIVGYRIAETLEAVESVRALKMAVSSLKKEPDSLLSLTHHSDSQKPELCSKK